ncbi:MAG TPA: 3-oxoacyl-ACP reductase family protein [Tepidisphaeraceae bacterium]|nr:3-oxoacyl-ACP reductase family protein [Tepidisphaeraceae bacterium]
MATGSKSDVRVLDGKVALVTGGSRGIGAAVSRRLAEAGATVLVNYAKSPDAARAVVEQIKSSGGKAHAVGGDVADPAQVREIFRTIDKDHGGKLHVVVNNAGIYRTGPLVELTDQDYESSFNTNVRAVFLVTREAVKRMAAGGRIITIGSVVGERAIAPGMSVYSATKFAVAGMTRAWAHEFAERGITANVVQPGPIDTDMNPADPAKNPAADQLRQQIPARRYGTADEVAAVVTFIASPAAAFVNGSTINVDGGVNA